MTQFSSLIQSARDQWQWRGQARPPFAAVPGPGQTSVWDFPRPPLLEVDAREVVIRWGDVEVARTRRVVLVLETSHPPSFYLPWDDVARHLLMPAKGSSFCEWKGPAQYWSLERDLEGDTPNGGKQQLLNVAWSYPQPMAGAELLANCVAFYPAPLDCRVDGAAVQAQPGGFYGGWITPELVGPFKGEPGSTGW